ncbi:MAG: hypothetical protein BKP49_09730 [Treponema sp. CETP13]|nr:MAG: hypothetical protein BKP49_09730 [Treponema sp. CETP13]
MKTLLLCPKDHGNTYTVFSYIQKQMAFSNACDLKVLSPKSDYYLTKAELQNYDRIIFGSGVYGGNLHKKLKEFLFSLKREDVKCRCKLYLALTWFGRSDSNMQVFNQAAEMLDEKGLYLQNNFFSCFGAGFGLVRLGHPNAKELAASLTWFKELDS